MEQKRIPYNEATKIVQEFKSRARFCITDRKCIRLKLIPVGSYRRKKETLKDIDFLIVLPKRYTRYKDKIIRGFKLVDSDRRSNIVSIIVNPKMNGVMHTQYRTTIRDRTDQFMIDLFLVPEESFPFAIFHYTGSKTFNIRTRAYVKKLGMTLNQYGLFDTTTKKKIKAGIKTERDIFKYLNITYKSPKQRSE